MEDEEVKEKVKLQTMILLNEKYGITEKDFTRAELEIVPATPAPTLPLGWAATARTTAWTPTPP